MFNSSVGSIVLYIGLSGESIKFFEKILFVNVKTIYKLPNSFVVLFKSPLFGILTIFDLLVKTIFTSISS
jgi:hypothetical protein